MKKMFFVRTIDGEALGYYEGKTPAALAHEIYRATGKHVKCTPAEIDEGREAFERIFRKKSDYFLSKEAALDVLCDDGGIGRDFMAECLEGEPDIEDYWAKFEARMAANKLPLTQQLVEAAEQYRANNRDFFDHEDYCSPETFREAVSRFVTIVPELPERWWE